MTNTRPTTIPFSGFYYSLHDRELDHALEYMFSNDYGTPYSGLIERAFDLVNWRDVHVEYARRFTENFAATFQLETLKFAELVSPKFYNFETDRIFCEISLHEVLELFEKVDRTVLEERIRSRFTSYDGFFSHYPNSIDRWPKSVADWDHNEIGTLIEAWVEQSTDGKYDTSEEYSIMEDPFEFSSRIIENNMKDADRIFRVFEYLRRRDAR